MHRLTRRFAPWVLVWIAVSDASVMSIDFVLLMLWDRTLVEGLAGSVLSVATLSVWLTCGTVGAYRFRELVWSRYGTHITMLILVGPPVMWARLHLSDCWFPTSPGCGPLSSTPILGVALSSIPFLIVTGVFHLRRLASGALSLAAVLRSGLLMTLLLFSFGLLWGALRLLNLRDVPLDLTPSSGSDLLLLLGFEVLAALGLLIMMLVAFVWRGGIPVHQALRSFALARRARFQGVSTDPFVIGAQTSRTGTGRLLTTYLGYVLWLVGFFALYFRLAVAAERSPSLGFFVLGASLFTSAAWTVLDVRGHKRRSKEMVASAIFFWVIPILGVVGWRVSGQLEGYWLLLISVPTIAGVAMLSLGWLPALVSRRYSAWHEKRHAVQSGQLGVVRQYLGLSRIVMDRLYDPGELRVWQLIIAVGIWGVVWGFPLVARFSGDQTAAETASEFSTGYTVAEFTAIAWMMLALFPVCRIGTLTFTRSVFGRYSPSSNSFLSMALTLLVFLGLTPMFLPLVAVIVGVSRALFGETGLELVVQFYFFPILLPWLYSMLLTGWLLMLGDWKSTAARS